LPAFSQSEIKAARCQALSFLRNNQASSINQDSGSGWFPYAAGGQASMEATAWGAIALRGELAVATAAASFIVRSQNKDGGDSTMAGAGRSDWNSGPAMLCLRLLSREHASLADQVNVKKSIAKGFAHLLDSRTEFFQPIGRLLLLMSQGAGALAYSRGWPWYPGCYHWIEPTSYSLLALKCPQVPDNELYKRIIFFANKFVTENSCQGGGWNHGNALTLGAYLPAYRLTTAEALLALQDLKETETVQSGIKYLQSLSADDTSSLSLAFSALALSAYDVGADQELTYLLKRQGKDGSFNSAIIPTAVAALALEAAQNPAKHVLRFK